MNFLWDKVTEWLKELLIGSIMSNLTGLFDNVNRQVAGIADNVGATPQAWNGGVFGMIRMTGTAPPQKADMVSIESPAAMVTSRKRSVLFCKTGLISENSASIICGSTPRKMYRHDPATERLSDAVHSSFSASASALEAVLSDSSTSLGPACLHTAVASAPPILPVPINPN